MELYLLMLNILVCSATISPYSSKVIPRNENTRLKNIPAVDALITRLEQEQWTADEEPCFRNTLDMLWGVKNNTLWATWVWDSMQPPVGSFYGAYFHMGNYDQCLQAPWSKAEYPVLQTQYCIVDVKTKPVDEFRKFAPFDNADEYIRTPTKHLHAFTHQGYGVCLSAACSPSTVTRIARHMHQLTHLPDGDVSVDPRDCRKAGEPAISWGFYGFWTLIGLLLATAAYSTYFKSEDSSPQTTFDIIINAFCIRRNYNALFKVNSDEIKVMNGMRFITAALVVVMHETMYTILCPLVNLWTLKEMSTSSLAIALNHMEVVVDTFFAMSGMLLIRGLMLGNHKNLWYTLVKRYTRLIGPFAISILYIISAAEYMGEGPFWSRATRNEVDVCVVNWWKSILMANTDVENLCHVVSWYVTCDFQLAILATFLFYLYRKNRKLGVIAFIAVFSGLTLNLAWMVYRYELPILAMDLKSILQQRNHSVLNYTYMKSYSRAGPYLVGMIMGYIITTYKPAAHRHVITKKWSIITVISCIFTMFTVLCIGSIFDGRPYNPIEAGIAVATNRTLWGLAICCIIGACEYGSVPMVTELLSWRGFVPLSKLSYCLYLLHPFVIQKEKFASRTALVYSNYSLTISWCGVAVLGCVWSLGLHLLLEAPLINISNALFTVKSKSSQSPGAKKETNNNYICINENGHSKFKLS